jgi:hypothetical protein
MVNYTTVARGDGYECPEHSLPHNRFNLSKIGDHFINPCCFGEDLAAWLRSKLGEKGVKVGEPYQEDWGWELPLTHESDAYFLCMSGNSDESSADLDEGQWRIIVEKRRSIGQRLKGAGEISENDRLMSMMEETLRADSSIREVHREP